VISFPPFKMDPAEERLWQGAKLLAVRRKPFAILRYLVANPQRLVTHQELLEHVWGTTVVSESAVRTHMHELRSVLGDGVIETVIGRGYRFTAQLGEDAETVRAAALPPEARTPAPERMFVGREAELATLRAAFERAHAGQRQVCFVTGEPGIGKTSLVDTFLEELEDRAEATAVRGQCVEQHGTPEAYLAVIEVLGQLRRSEHGERTLAALVKFAPTFLAQLPHLVPDGQLDEVAKRARAGSDGRTVREVIEAIESLATAHTIVIVLEDLQWSDVATIDLLALLGQRRERARLLVIATARRAEAQTVTHPLNRVMRGLVTRANAAAVPLDRIAAGAVARFVEMRFPGHAFAPGFIAAVDRITGGTPLFVVSILDDLVARGMIREDGGRWRLMASIDDVAAHRPDSVKQMIDIQLDRLGAEEQRVLEAASVIGQEFPTGLVAAALEIPAEHTDELCDALARRGLFLRREASEDWPDGTCQTRFALTHGLVQEVCLGRTAQARRQRWHRLIAEHLERVFGGDGAGASEMAKTLATHYDMGQVPAKAVHYYAFAAERTQRRHASRDALRLFQRGLELLRRLPETPERDAMELRILTGMSPAVLRVAGEAGKDSIADFERMVALARRSGDETALCGALVNLAFRHCTLAEYRRADAVCAEFAEIAARAASVDPNLAGFADTARALALFWAGRIVEAGDIYDALTGGELAMLVSDARTLGVLGLTDRTTVLLTYASAVRWMRGEGSRALAESQRAIALARATNDPYPLGLALVHGGRLRMLRGDAPETVCEPAEVVLGDPALEVWHEPASLLLAWARSHQAPLDAEACDRMVRELSSRLAMFPMGRTYLGMGVVDALARSGRGDEALALCEDAIAWGRERAELVFVPELVRLRGEILASKGDAAGAAAAYRESMTIAVGMAAPGFELRAALRLAALARGTADEAEAVAAVRRVYGGFAAPEDDADQRTARALLGLPG
jgi:DNA-binding winged helix-turn-helix (wHTH) protein